MKKALLFASVVLTIASAKADYKVYYPVSPGDSFTYGNVSGISASGRYAVIADEDNWKGYLWDINDPETLTLVNATEAGEVGLKCTTFDVNDSGMVVGEVYLTGGKKRPAYKKKDGKWTILPVPEITLNTAFAFRVSNDGKYIGGTVMVNDPKIETNGGYRPILWTLDENGEYQYSYNPTLPESVNHHQGFWMQDMSEDGSTFVGYLMVGKTQCTIPSLCINGEYAYFDLIEEKREPWYYKGEIMGYDDEYYIDGFHDTTPDKIAGGLAFYDNDTKCAYGFRTVITDVSEDGNSATLTTGACIYDTTNRQFTDNPAYQCYAMAYDDVIFLGNLNGTSVKNLLVEGQPQSIADFFGVNFSRNIGIIDQRNDNLTVVGGAYQEVNPASGELEYFPMIVATNNFDSVDKVAVSNVSFRFENNTLIVDGTESASVFALNGSLIATGNNINLQPGLYVVKAGDKVQKICIK